MTRLHVDFETRSAADLKVVGLDNYARHETTDAWCMGYAFNRDAPEMWARGDTSYSGSFETMMDLIDRGATVVAHNAAFELAIWNKVMVPRYRWPVLRPAQVRCTMAMAYAMALPGSLEKAAAAVGIVQQKDMAGHRLMLQMAKPKDGGGWWDDAEKQKALQTSCAQDVRVEQELDSRLVQLSDDEQALWLLDYTINQRGVGVDAEVVRRAIAIVQVEQDRLNTELRTITGNYVGFATEVARLKQWAATRGVILDGAAKADIIDALAGDLPADVRAALIIRQEAAKTSTAKLRGMIEAASEDGRLRGMFQYHAAGTGRWGGRRVQLHNLPRPKLSHCEISRGLEIIRRQTATQSIATLTTFYAPPLDMISWGLRAMLRAAPDHDLLVADFSSIEGRGVAWLAGEQSKLDVYEAADNKTGPEVYKLTASAILGKPVSEITPEERQTYGKVPELACGYGGGVGAFQQMAKTYLVKVPNSVAEFAKTRWRDANPLTVAYWAAIEWAAIDAMMRPGSITSVGPKGREVRFRRAGSFLWCLLPSGRALCYPYPKIKPKLTPWGEEKDALHYMHVGINSQWQETHTYGGKLTENVTQAICRDLLVSAIRNVEAAGFPVILHVHDEVVAEVPRDGGDLGYFEQLCSRAPAWAAGFPVVAKGWRGERYRK